MNQNDNLLVEIAKGENELRYLIKYYHLSNGKIVIH